MRKKKERARITRAGVSRRLRQKRGDDGNGWDIGCAREVYIALQRMRM